MFPSIDYTEPDEPLHGKLGIVILPDDETCSRAKGAEHPKTQNR